MSSQKTIWSFEVKKTR